MRHAALHIAPFWVHNFSAAEKRDILNKYFVMKEKRRVFFSILLVYVWVSDTFQCPVIKVSLNNNNNSFKFLRKKKYNKKLTFDWMLFQNCAATFLARKWKSNNNEVEKRNANAFSQYAAVWWVCKRLFINDTEKHCTDQWIEKY